MVSLIILICPPVVIVSAVAGFVLTVIGAMRRDNGMLSLELMLFGASLAFTGFVLGSLDGWVNARELSNQQNLGRALLFALGGIGAACAVLGSTGTWSKGFFWRKSQQKR